MPIVTQPAADGSFDIALPAAATADQVSLKARFIPLLPPLVFKRGIPGYQPLLERLYKTAQRAFDGVAGAPADPQSALVELGEITAELKRLEERPGRYVVDLPLRTHPTQSREIVFSVTPSASPVPTDQLAFKAEVDSTLTTLQVIFPASAQPTWYNPTPPGDLFDQYRTKLFSLAQVGLQGDADPKAARQALATLHEEILLREGPLIKNGYMRRLGLWALALGGATAATYMIVRNNAGFSIQFAALKNMFLLWTGTMIGAWLSFGIRKPTITLKDLSNLEADMVEPPLRLLFTGFIALTIAFIFLVGMVNVTIGGLKSAELLFHGSTALVIGLMLGVSEQTLPGALTRRASQFVSEFAGK